MKRVLFLTYRMAKGYGVDVVVASVVRQLAARGVHADIACLDTDGFYPLKNIYLVEPTVESVTALARRLGVRALVAHTSPFYEILAKLDPKEFGCWAWEYGDPTPDFFGSQADARRQTKAFKRDHCYPRMKGVITISEFIRRDIEYTQAQVVYCGSDHAPDLGDKPARGVGPLRVGALMRLGVGEAQYKGSAELLEFFGWLDRARFAPALMGRGTPADARPFESQGIQVVLNAEDDEKWKFLRELDVLVTFSRWEGFNLPLVEAQALGTPGLALKVAAHPEVTQLLFEGVTGALELVERLERDRSLLAEQSRRARAFVRERFAWIHNADACIALLGEDLQPVSEVRKWTACKWWLLSYIQHPRKLVSIVRNRLRKFAF